MTKNQNTKQFNLENRVPEFAEEENSHILNILTFLFRICFDIRISIFEFMSFK